MRPFQVLSQLHKASRQIQIYMTARCRPYGVSTVEAHLLGYCTGYGPCSISELHRVLGEKRSTLTAMLDRLERQELISRQLNPEDRRSWLVVVKPKGRKLSQQLRKVYEEFESSILARLTPEQVKCFQDVMGVIGQTTNVAVDKKRRARKRQ